MSGKERERNMDVSDELVPGVERTAADLHELALRYWSDGRLEDGLRLAKEAGHMLDRAPSETGLQGTVRSTISAIEAELEVRRGSGRIA